MTHIKLSFVSLFILGLVGCDAASPATDNTKTSSGGKADDNEDGTTDETTGPICGTACSFATDCPATEPYCNQEAGLCQQTPPECVTDDDCVDSFCWDDGYCLPYAPLNCPPGWSGFEGVCDNVVCEQSECPEGTKLDEATCECKPTGPAPDCSYASPECTAAYPYCNYEAGKCQQTPVQCVGDSDCTGDDGPFCLDDGYCSGYPRANCRPGWGYFEGACDNPACEQTECPEGTQLDDECLCLPVCGK